MFTNLYQCIGFISAASMKCIGQTFWTEVANYFHSMKKQNNQSMTK